MKSLITALLLLLQFGALSAQSDPDSLWSAWRNADLAPSERLDALHTIIHERYLFDDPDSAYILARSGYELARQHDLKAYMAASQQAMGGSFYVQSEYDSALHYFDHSLTLFEEIGDKSGMASTLGNMANIITEQGDYAKGLDHYMRALKAHEAIGNKRGQGVQLMNIGLVHDEMEEPEKAYEHFQRALALHEEIGYTSGMADCLVNIGNYHLERKDLSRAMASYERCSKLYEEIVDMQGRAYAINSIGRIHLLEGRYDEALDFMDRAYAMQRDLGDENSMAMSLISRGEILIARKEYRRAISALKEAMVIGERLQAVRRLEEASGKLYQAYKALGDPAESLRYYEQHIALRDSILREENQRELYRQEYKYTYESRAMADSIAYEADRAIHAQEIQREKTVRNAFIGGFALVGLFAGVFLFQRIRIASEKKRSDQLLLNILPEEVAGELKAKGEAEARSIEQVTVLFTDFKGFTALSEKLSPKDLVRDIHECFSAFDGIADKYGIEKIKTIGDAYMAAGGLPTPNRTHAEDVVRAALEMRDFIAEGKARKIKEELPYFEIRIGVHTGPVVAGIVGVKKFQYDIWGDTVNIASRMESSGEAGQVNISENTFALVNGLPGFRFIPRGKIMAKGKGELEMFFVERKTEGSTIDLLEHAV